MGVLADNGPVAAAHGAEMNFTTTDDDDEFAAFLREGEWRGNFYHLAPTILEKGFSPIPFYYEWNRKKEKYDKETKFRWKPFQTHLMTEVQLKGTLYDYGDAPLVAIPTGDYSGITVVDVDGDANDIDFAIDTFGETDVMVQTASFGVHLYYRFNGEKCPTRILERPIDIRGQGGCIIVPGSFLDGEYYQFIAGGWDDIDALEYANSLDTKHETQPSEASFGGKIREGSRDQELFDHGRHVVGSFFPSIDNNDAAHIEVLMTNSREKFTKHLVQWNQIECVPPLPKLDVVAKAKYLWKRKLEGSLFEDGRRMIGIPTEERFMELARKDPRAFSLLIQLRTKFVSYRPFTLPQSRSAEFALSPKTFGGKIQILVKSGFLYQRHRGGRFSTSFAKKNRINGGHGDANVYILSMP